MRKTSFLIIFFFLWAQVAATLHGAEHGFKEHRHGGERCELAAFVKHSNALDVPESQSLPALVVWEDAFHTAHQTHFYSTDIRVFSARDPPSFS